jgi:TRAP-type C4-dicarboxylate transport system permease small subunit
VNFLNSLEKGLVRFEKWVMVASMAVMLVAVAMQVFFRYVITLSIPWTQDLALITFMLVIFYGAAFASFHDRHLGIRNIVDTLPETTFIVVWFVQKAVIVGFMLIVIVAYAIPMTLQGLTNTFTMIKIPVFCVLVQIPIFGVLTTFHVVMSALRRDYRKEFDKAHGR